MRAIKQHKSTSNHKALSPDLNLPPYLHPKPSSTLGQPSSPAVSHLFTLYSCHPLSSLLHFVFFPSGHVFSPFSLSISLGGIEALNNSERGPDLSDYL